MPGFYLIAVCCFSFCNSDVDTSNHNETGHRFKIESSIFQNKAAKPVSTNLTLFDDGIVYDFRFEPASESPAEITIFQANKRKFVLLDVERRCRLNLDQIQLFRMLDGMKQEIDENDSVSWWLFQDFEENYDAEANELSVNSDKIRYHVKGVRPTDNATLAAYFGFLNEYTRLSVSNPNRTPPFARMQLNVILKKYGLLPVRVDLEIRHESKQVQQTAHSEHELHRSWSATDIKLAEQAKEFWMQFDEVDLSAYRQIEFTSSD